MSETNIATPVLNSNLIFAALSLFNTTDVIEESNLAVSQQEVVVSQSRYTSSTSTFFNDRNRFSLTRLLDNKRKLINISRLNDNWNGYGSPSINQSIITLVMNLIDDLEIQPSIFPTGRGTLQLEFNGLNDSYLEFEFGEQEISFFSSKDEEENEGSISEDQISSLIHEFQK